MTLPPLLPRSVHGGPSAAAFTGTDFSVNTNPYGPNPLLLRAAREADYAHYPDPTYQHTKQRLADWHGVTPGQVALSVGASDLLHRIARAFLPADGGLLSLYAPFGELERAAQLQRATVEVVNELSGPLPQKTRLVYVGQPHNPTGRSLSTGELQRLAETCAEAAALLIVDLAYAPFTAPPLIHHPAALQLYSPGKAHGLVGARPAYAIAEADITMRLDNLAPAWHLPASTAAVLAALPDAQDFLAQTLPLVAKEAQALAEALAPFGAVEHHGTPYMTLEVGNAPRVTRDLLALGARVRDCTSYGLPTRIRVSTRGQQDDGLLVRLLAQVLG